MKVLNLFVAALMFLAANANADHNSTIGSVDRLAYEAEQLFNTVQYHPLNYAVKDSVFRFSQDTRQLEQCSRQFNPGHAGCSHNCRPYLDQVRRSFYQVDRYLIDTYYQFPQVYNQYNQTKVALDAVILGATPNPGPFPGPYPQPNPYPAPNPYPNPYPHHPHHPHNPNPWPNGPGNNGRMFVCIAVDNGWEEHGGGHVAYGRFIQEAQRNALQQCQQVHGACRIQSCNQQ